MPEVFKGVIIEIDLLSDMWYNFIYKAERNS